MPGRLILTTTGTSAVEKGKLAHPKLDLWEAYKRAEKEPPPTPSPSRLLTEFSAWKAAAETDTLEFFKAYQERLPCPRIEEFVRLPRQGLGENIFGAEHSSLYLFDRQYPFSPDDRVILLSSDTAEGLLCCHLCMQTLPNVIPALTPEQISIELIPGLQPDQFDSFFQTGVKSLGNRIVDLVYQPTTELALLNITGGFKGLVATAAMIGRDLKLRQFFVFEEAPKLAFINPHDLPPLTREEARAAVSRFVGDVECPDEDVD